MDDCCTALSGHPGLPKQTNALKHRQDSQGAERGNSPALSPCLVNASLDFGGMFTTCLVQIDMKVLPQALLSRLPNSFLHH